METMYVPSDYEPPTLTELGKFEDLTKATNLGEDTDVMLPRMREHAQNAFS
jgi:hypothetical protein